MQILEHLLHKLYTILQTGWGWLVGAAIFLMDYFAGHSFIVFLVVAVTLMDACWGIAVSVKQGRFTLSELARLTIAKIAVYGCALFVFVGLDKMADTILTTALIGSAIVLVEFWSSCGSMLILFPNFLFLRLLKKALKGEIASKLHISEDDVDKVLENCGKAQGTVADATDTVAGNKSNN
jgi:hypothetical protein